ncbi:MAG: hypothetical protein ABUL49_01735, partial [bacterium]
MDNSFLLYAEVSDDLKTADSVSRVAATITGLGCACTVNGNALRVSAASAESLLSAIVTLSNEVRPARTVAGDCSETTISAGFAFLRNIAREVGFSFPVVAGAELADFIASGLSSRPVSMGLQRFEDLLPLRELFCLVPKEAVGPRFEKLGLGLVDNNLPNVWDSYVGRERETAECLELIRSFSLLTIKGCGGIGKSRFAIHLAAASRRLGFEVIRFVPLSQIKPGAPVEPAFLAACNHTRQGVEGFVKTYQTRKTLVVLDNCEHVLIGARKLVHKLTQDFPLLTVVATSR